MVRWGIAALLLVVPVVAFASSATSPREILWIDKDHVLPMFIPEEILNERGWDDLPWTPEMQESLRSLVERVPKIRSAPACQSLKVWREDPASYAPVDLKTIVESSELAVTGKVIGHVTGWSTWDSRVVTMVHISVAEVLSDVNGDIEPGEVVMIRELHGDLTIHGIRLCVNPQPGYYAPATGDEVLVAGNRWEGDARLVVSHFLYSVSGGQVAARAFTPISTGAVTLDSVRAATRIGRDTQ